MKKKKVLSAAVSLLLCLIMLTGMIPSIFANPAAPEVRGVDAKAFAFAMSSVESNLTVSADRLFQMLFPSLNLSEAEADYLKENLFSLTYNASVPSDTVQTSYNKDTGVLDVRVSIYSYTAENGSVVRWIPQKAFIGDAEQPLVLDGDAYVCKFGDLYQAEEDFDMEVVFAWTVDFSEEAVEMLLLKSRYDGVAAEEALDRYADELQAYYDALAAYNACIQYEKDRAARDQYEKELAQYQLDKAEYDRYVEKKNVYDAQKKAYDDYLDAVRAYEDAWNEYETYKKLMEDYSEQSAAYLVYQQQMNAVMARLRILETMYVADSRGWRFSSSVLGDLVDLVIANRKELEKVGYTEGDAVANSTMILRGILNDYLDCRDNRWYASPYERYKALYRFYAEHYEELSANLNLLYDALKLLYGNDVIVDYIETKGKGEHFRQFLAQLYVFKCCLTDAETINPNWTPHSRLNKTLAQVLEPCHILEDIQSNPLKCPYPDVMVEEIVPPDPVDPPVGPPTVVFPPEEDEPVEVKNPTEPVFVADPGNPPPAVSHPGNILPTHTLTAAQVAWASIYKSIDYRTRELLVQNRSLTFETTLTRNISIDNLFRVAFYTYDGKMIGEPQYFHYGDNANAIRYPAVPSRENTAQYTYRFRGWKLFNGEDRTGSTITSDVSLIATYEEQVRFYEVSWEIDGKLIEAPKKYAYGTIPTHNQYVPNVKTENYKEYLFSGWSPSIEPVTGDITYRGSYAEVERYYTVTWILDGGARVETQRVLAGTVPVYTGNRDYVKNSKHHRFSHWATELSVVGSDVTYEAIYHAGVPLSTDQNGEICELEVRADVIEVAVRGELSLRTLAEYAMEHRKNLLLRCQEMGVLISYTDLPMLLQNSCMRIEFSAKNALHGKSYTLAFYNVAGKSLQIDLPVKLLYYYESGANGAPAFYCLHGDEKVPMTGIRADGVLQIEQVGGGSFLPLMEYYLRYESVANCNTLKLPTQLAEGDFLDFGLVNCAYGYEVTGAILTYADGTIQTVTANGFFMPAGTVSVTLTVERVIYRVSFVVDGVVIETKEYFMGEEITPPADPKLEKGDGWIYTFSGWSPHVTLAIGENRDLIYTAQFFAGTAVTEAELLAYETNTITKRLVLYACILLAMIAVIVLSIVFRKKIWAVALPVIVFIWKKISALTSRVIGFVRERFAKK